MRKHLIRNPNMKARYIFSLVLLALINTSAGAQEGALKLERVPEIGRGEADRIRANLATSKIGTSVSETAPTQTPPGAPQALGQDKSARLKLPAGVSLVPLTMADFYGVNRAFFRSFSAAGKVRVIGSDRELPPDSPEWEELVPETDFSPRQFLDENFADQTLKFVVFVFDISVPGEVSPLGLMGEEFIDQASALPPTAEQLDEIPESEKASLVPYDFASIINGSAITLISSGPVVGANSMIDDDSTSFYEFEPEDPSATILLDMRSTYRVNRVTLTMDAPPGSLHIYAFNILPAALQDQLNAETEGSSAPVLLDPAFFESIFPVGSKEFAEEVDVVELNFDDIDARFALLRWVPSENNTSDNPIRVYELSFIGLIPDEMAAIRLVPSAEFAPDSGIPIPSPQPIPVDPPPAASAR